MVSNITTDDGRCIHQRSVAAIYQAGLCIGIITHVAEKGRCNVDSEQGAHAVKGKTFPHFNIGKLPKDLGVSEKLARRNVRGIRQIGLGIH